MKSLFMGHIKQKVASFTPYNADAFTKKGVFFGLWAWRNILKMDTYYGNVCPEALPSNLPVDNMKGFLEGYDMVLVIGLKEGTYVRQDEPDGYNRIAWLRKVAPHLKIALTSDFTQSFYTLRNLGYNHHVRYKMFREQINDADVFLQLCWAYVHELREFFKLKNIYTVLPVDFNEYKYQLKNTEIRSKNRNLIAVTRHNENSHPNIKEMIKIAKLVKKVNKDVEYRFFSISKPEHLASPEIIKKHWLDYGVDWTYFTDILPFMFAPDYFSQLSECRLFFDCVMIHGAGPRFTINASMLSIPSVINTGLGHTLMPELSTRRVTTFQEKPDYDGYVKKISLLLNDDKYYNTMCKLSYQRLWNRCRGDVAKKTLFQLLDRNRRRRDKR